MDRDLINQHEKEQKGRQESKKDKTADVIQEWVIFTKELIVKLWYSDFLLKYSQMLWCFFDLWTKIWWENLWNPNTLWFNENYKSKSWFLEIEFDNWIPKRFFVPEWCFSIQNAVDYKNRSKILSMITEERYLEALNWMFNVNTLKAKRNDNESTWFDRNMSFSWPIVSISTDLITKI